MGILWRASPVAVVINVGLVAFVGVMTPLQIEVNGRLVDAIADLARAVESSLTLDGSGGSISGVTLWVAAMVGIQFLRAALNALRGVARARLRERAGVRLQQLVIERAGSVPLEQYEQAEFYDRLQRAQQAATWRSFVIFENMLRTFELFINVIGLLVLILTAHYGIAVLLTVGAIPMVVSHIKRGRETYALHRKQTPEQRRAQYHVELLTNREAAKELRLYGLGGYLLNRWEQLATKLRQERLQLTISQQIRLASSRLVSVLTYVGSIVILVWLGLIGRISIGDVVKYIDSANRFPNQLTQAMRNLSTLFEELLYLSDLREFTELRAEHGYELEELPEGPIAIEFDDVSFAYPGGPLVLKNLSFRLEAGEKVALVGLNGAGKTTLIKLLLGLYQPTTGRILINGRDLRTLEPDTLRRKAAAVFQDYLRYQLTARENIGFGRAEAVSDEDRLEEAASAGGAAEIIHELPSGYDTVLGRHFEGGKDLSGGQWQRLAISRSYFRNAQVLVLDEPTAALDPKAELAVFQEFRRLAEGKTAIFVSHRMASARIADRIMVLKQGRLIESGHHDELVKTEGEYARMFAMQSHWYMEDLSLDDHEQEVTRRSIQGGAAE